MKVIQLKHTRQYECDISKIGHFVIIDDRGDFVRSKFTKSNGAFLVWSGKSGIPRETLNPLLNSLIKLDLLKIDYDIV